MGVNVQDIKGLPAITNITKGPLIIFSICNATDKACSYIIGNGQRLGTCCKCGGRLETVEEYCSVGDRTCETARDQYNYSPFKNASTAMYYCYTTCSKGMLVALKPWVGQETAGILGLYNMYQKGTCGPKAMGWTRDCWDPKAIQHVLKDCLWPLSRGLGKRMLGS